MFFVVTMAFISQSMTALNFEMTNCRLLSSMLEKNIIIIRHCFTWTKNHRGVEGTITEPEQKS